MGAAGPYWWLWAWAAWMAFQLLVLVLYPTLIAPLFNKFTPMEDNAARERVEALLARCGFRSAGLFVMDGSKRSGHGNAYFTGFGKAKRIVFFDTLLLRLAPDEIEAVLAHELGHFKLRHVAKRILWSAVLSLAIPGASRVACAGALVLRGPRHSGSAAAVALARPGVALELFLLALPVFTFLLEPLSARIRAGTSSRRTRSPRSMPPPHALTAALVKLYEDNAATLTPDPLHSAFYDSHPPAAVRIARIARWQRTSRAARGMTRASRAPPFAPQRATVLHGRAAGRWRARCSSRLPSCRAAPALCARRRGAAGARPSATASLPRQKFGTAAAIYMRTDRRVTSAAQLLAQVQRCNAELAQRATSPTKRRSVARFLNATYYTFKP